MMSGRDKMDIFAQRLKRLREEAGLRRVVLAELCGLDRCSITDYERGRREPQLGAVVRLADFFGVSLDYLVGREIPNSQKVC